MKKVLSAIVFALAMIVSMSAMANHELVPRENSCHFVFDANNADHEEKVGGCVPRITTNGDGTAYGSVTFVTAYDLTSGTAPNFTDGGLLKGSTADPTVYGDDYVTATAVCELQDGDDVFVSTDWDLRILAKVDNDLLMNVIWKLHCRGGIAQ